jgi:hypothetical protein
VLAAGTGIRRTLRNIRQGASVRAYQQAMPEAAEKCTGLSCYRSLEKQ